MDKKLYWPTEINHIFPMGIILEARAEIALKLIESFGTIAAKVEGEDSAGRSKILLQSPQELVDRCFEIAELFIQRAESTGLLTFPIITEEEKAIHAGKIERIKLNESYKRKESTVNNS